MKKILSKIFIVFAFLFSIVGNILATELRQQEYFSVKDLSQKVSETISSQSKSEIYGVKYGYLSREGSEKNYSFEEAEKSGIKDLLIITSLTLNPDNSFEMVITPDNQSYKLIASGKYTESKKIPVASKMIKKGAVIEDEDISFKYIPEEKVTSLTLDSKEYIVGKEARKNIFRNAQINSGDIINPIVIKKGKAVVAIYREKNMEVKVTAQAMSDGRQGEIIKLKNIDSGKEFLGMAVRQNTAIVNFQDDILASK